MSVHQTSFRALRPISGADEVVTDSLQLPNALRGAAATGRASRHAPETLASCTIPFGTEVDGYHCETRIEDVRPGDAIQTRDNGYQTVLWAGSRVLCCCDEVHPIKFAPGSIGNTQPITVSPSHMFMLAHPAAKKLFGVAEVLVEARHLVNGKDIFYTHTRPTTYFQILFESHQVILANGIPSASLYVNSRTLHRHAPDHRSEWLEALPALQDTYMNRYGPTARLVLRERDVSLLQAHGRFQNRHV